MEQDEADFSGESTAAVGQWKEWILKAIERIGETPASQDPDMLAVKRMRELWKGVKAAEAELKKRDEQA